MDEEGDAEVACEEPPEDAAQELEEAEVADISTPFPEEMHFEA